MIQLTPPSSATPEPIIPQNQANATISCGLEVDFVSNLTMLWTQTRNERFDFLAIPLVHPRYERDLVGFGTAKESTVNDEPFTRSDLILDSSQWNCIVGKISSWIELDSPNEHFQKMSQKV